MMAAPWTEEESDIIKQMHSAGATLDDIALVLKSRPKESIKDRGYAIGLKWSKKPEIDYEAFKAYMKGKKHGS
jgi:hypothetical protein